MVLNETRCVPRAPAYDTDHKVPLSCRELCQIAAGTSGPKVAGTATTREQMRMSAERYRKMAADYEVMARRATDHVLQNIYSEFARQWSGWADEAETEDRERLTSQ